MFTENVTVELGRTEGTTDGTLLVSETIHRILGLIKETTKTEKNACTIYAHDINTGGYVTFRHLSLWGGG